MPKDPLGLHLWFDLEVAPLSQEMQHLRKQAGSFTGKPIGESKAVSSSWSSR